MKIYYQLMIIFLVSVSAVAQEIIVEKFASPSEYHKHYAEF